MSSPSNSTRPEIRENIKSSPSKFSESEFEALVDLLGVDSDAEGEVNGWQQPQLVERLYTAQGDMSRTGNHDALQDACLLLNMATQSKTSFSRNTPTDALNHPAKQTYLASEHVGVDLIDLSDTSPNCPTMGLPLQESTPSRNTKAPREERSSEVASIKATLELVHKERDELKQRCCELEALLRSDRHSEDKIDMKQAPSISSENLPRSGHVDRVHEHRAPDIDNLSLPQARVLLKFLLRTLSLSVTDVQCEAQRDTSVSVPPRLSLTLRDVCRSVELVSYVDELVWRRSRLGCRYDNPYGEDNIMALKERIDLWEKVIRARR